MTRNTKEWGRKNSTQNQSVSPFKKINIKLTKTKSKKTQINKIRDERGIVTMDSTKI